MVARQIPNLKAACSNHVEVISFAVYRTTGVFTPGDGWGGHQAVVVFIRCGRIAVSFCYRLDSGRQ